jgi:hypothetical protein
MCLSSLSPVEGLMLHTKAVATQDTTGWKTACRDTRSAASCRLGTPFPEHVEEGDLSLVDKDGWKYNCYVNHKIDDYWVPRLEANMKERISRYEKQV